MRLQSCLLAAGLLLAALLATGCPQGSTRPSGTRATDYSALPTPAGPQEAVLQGKSVLFVVAPKDFRDEEYTVPHDILTEAGAKVDIASTEPGTATGVDGTQVQATVAARDARPDDYDAIVFVGGPGMVTYLDDRDFVAAAKAFAEADKPVAAICVAPGILANAGLLEGRRATSWESQREELKAAGAELADEDAVVDGKIITAPGPEAAQAFADAILAVMQADG